MLDRFLTYSLRHQKPIKLVFLDGQEVARAQNLIVLELKDDEVQLRPNRKDGKPFSLPRCQLLSASYVRGDEGALL